jgi:hypothetical protein
VVAVPTEIPAELIEEGIARELTHRIQSMRKEAGFEIADYIVTYYQAELSMQKAIESQSAYIKQETLSKELLSQPPAEGAFSQKAKIEGREVTLGVERAVIERDTTESQLEQVSQPPQTQLPVPEGTPPSGQFVEFKSTITCRTKKSSGDFVNIPDEYVSLFPPPGPDHKFDIHTVDGVFRTCVVPPHEGGRSHFHSKEFFDQHKYLQSGDVVEIRVGLGPVKTYYLRLVPKGGRHHNSGS